MCINKKNKSLGAVAIITAVLSTTVFASSISVTTLTDVSIVENADDGIELYASTSTTGWKTGTITDVIITDNETKYNESYLKSKIKQDSFAARFKIYSASGEFYTVYPTSVRTLYGSASAYDAYQSGNYVFVKYKYNSSAEDYEANVVVRYTIS